MRLSLIVLAALLCVAVPAVAGPVTLVWDAAPNSTASDVQQMICTGNLPTLTCGQWATVKADVLHSAACQAGSCSTAYTAPAGLVLFRFVQKNAFGTMLRPDAGPWHNEAWTLPGQATNVGTR
jgi:ABC-type enterobactin transport system permease subunit